MERHQRAGTRATQSDVSSIGTFDDDSKSWPESGKLLLDGLVYERFSGGAPKDAKKRLDWLARQESFAPQPYRQLAKVLRNEGNDAGARRVLAKRESLRRVYENRDLPRHIQLSRLALSALLRWTIGYGYYASSALWWLVGLALLGVVLFWGGYCAGSIAPTDKQAYDSFKQNSQLPHNYEGFHPFVYSLENSFPLVKLGQVDHWQPDPNADIVNLVRSSSH